MTLLGLPRVARFSGRFAEGIFGRNVKCCQTSKTRACGSKFGWDALLKYAAKRTQEKGDHNMGVHLYNQLVLEHAARGCLVLFMRAKGFGQSKHGSVQRFPDVAWPAARSAALWAFCRIY